MSPQQNIIEKRLSEKVSEFAVRQKLWKKNDRIMIGVSGGGDSVALLHLLHRLSTIDGLKLTVVHPDHCLRGSASREDAAWVRHLASRLNIPCVTGRWDIPPEEKESGRSPEEAARIARYGFFQKISARTGITTVVVAHHADDQAETVLFKLLRGSSPAGLGGMRPSRQEGFLRIIRPLLTVRRRELREYLDSIGEGYRKIPPISTADFSATGFG